MSSDSGSFQDWLSRNEIEKVTRELYESNGTPKVVIFLRSQLGDGYQVSILLAKPTEEKGDMAKRFGIKFDGTASCLKGNLLAEEDLGERVSFYLTSEIADCEHFGIRSLKKKAILEIQYFYLLPEPDRPKWKGKILCTAPESPRVKAYHGKKGGIRKVAVRKPKMDKKVLSPVE